MKLTTILVPLDGSALAEAALVSAIELARERGAKLLLLRAAEAHTFPMADPTESQVAAVRDAEQYLASVRDATKRASVADVDVTVWYGPPAQAIVEAAQYRKADLIVMSSHGRSGLGRLVLGSVAETVLRSTAVPILLIRPGAAPLDTPFAGAPAAKEVAP
jgi:nucleotide-binding universal stress UspA family protein